MMPALELPPEMTLRAAAIVPPIVTESLPSTMTCDAPLRRERCSGGGDADAVPLEAPAVRAADEDAGAEIARDDVPCSGRGAADAPAVRDDVEEDPGAAVRQRCHAVGREADRVALELRGRHLVAAVEVEAVSAVPGDEVALAGRGATNRLEADVLEADAVPLLGTAAVPSAFVPIRLPTTTLPGCVAEADRRPRCCRKSRCGSRRSCRRSDCFRS